MKSLTKPQSHAMYKMEKQDAGFGVQLNKKVGESLEVRGLCVQRRGDNRYSLTEKGKAFYDA